MNDFAEILKNKTNEELLVMVYEFDQWSSEMLIAVEKELANRNILPTDIRIIKQKMIDIEDIELTEGRAASLMGQIIGWLTVFGWLGIFFGYTYAYSKVKSKYNDKIFYKYNVSSRKNGKILFYTSILLSVLGILSRFSK